MIHLSYQNLFASVRSSSVLDDINLELNGPGVVAVLGPSGVGKSTLLRLTQRLIENGRDQWNCGGEILLNGVNLLGKSVSRRALAREVGYLSQRVDTIQ